MNKQTKPEVWMRGSIEGIPALLQPVAHAILQMQEELTLYVQDFPEELLWQKVAGLASVGFHIQHITGVLDRMCTYARQEGLSEHQLAFLKAEGEVNINIKIADLIENLNMQVQRMLVQLKHTTVDSLTEIRGIGRQHIPTTHLGLLFHAAEHAQRHLGQLLVTSQVLLHKKN
ncbi:DinB family protein [Zhouia sp. PK063]|uniref:DinB family protein n=1 Tax=Zhouia sp. PK063 TaxID=3373602 RepID=UPI0037BB38D1